MGNSGGEPGLSPAQTNERPRGEVEIKVESQGEVHEKREEPRIDLANWG